MATSQMANARIHIGALAQTILPPSRVALGVVDLAAPVEFFQDLTAQDPFFLILPGRYANWDQNQRTRDIVIPAKLWYAIPANQDFDGTTVEDVNENMLDTFTDYNKWLGAFYGGPQPKEINGPTYEAPDMELQPGVGFYTWEFTFWGSARA